MKRKVKSLTEKSSATKLRMLGFLTTLHFSVNLGLNQIYQWVFERPELTFKNLNKSAMSPLSRTPDPIFYVVGRVFFEYEGINVALTNKFILVMRY